MSTALNAADNHQIKVDYIEGARIAIVVADWNSKYTYALLDGAQSAFAEAGYSDGQIDVYHVPGTVELTFAAQQLVKNRLAGAVIVIGCVIRGDTPHFDYVCQSVTQGVTMLNATGDVPVVFGVLTVDTEQQAIERCGGALGNKGIEYADCAVKMMKIICEIKK